MKRIALLVVDAMVAAASVLSAQAVCAGSADRKSVFVNYDDTHYALSRTQNGIVPDEAEIRGLVRQYRGTDVTDLLFCIGGRLADVPNGAKQSWCDKYHQTRENGRDVCYTNHYIGLYRELYEVRKIDRFALWCDEARKVGIHPWLSFRLNDCHDNDKPTSFLHPDFFHEHPECRRIRHREPRGYFDRCLDFDCAAVRERELKFIGEMLERYDADGVELDWQREIYCFRPGCESAGTLTAFMRWVREMANAAAKRRGHPVKVMVRVPADPETALRFGFDVASWADAKLVDVLVPCPRWETTDNEIPTDLWKRLLRGSGVTLAPGIEIRICDHPWKRAFYMLTDQLVGAAAWHYSAGADGIYFFNYFDDPGWRKPETQYWKGFDQPLETMGVWWGNQLKWLKFIGHPAAVLAAPRDHMLTYRDIVPLWEDVRRPFPTTVRPGQVKFFRLATGFVPAGRKLTLRIGVKGGEPPKRVFVNSRPCAYVRNEACVPAFTDAPLCCYSVPAYEDMAAVVEIVADAAAELTHLDLQVE